MTPEAYRTALDRWQQGLLLRTLAFRVTADSQHPHYAERNELHTFLH